MQISTGTALILIDMQNAIDDPSWARGGARNHKNAELTAIRLLEAWRATGRPVFHVRHDSVEPLSTYRPGQPGNAFKAGLEPRDGEAVIPKHTGSAFTGTPLEGMLRAGGWMDLAIAGVITNNSVETTVRHAATLGFNVMLAEDACFTFGRRDWLGTLRTADEVHAMSLANLDGEYCRVTTSAELLAAAGSPLPVLPYFEASVEWLPGCDDAPAAAEYVAELICRAEAGARVEHVGSTAVPGCGGKGVLDLLVTCAGGGLEDIKAALSSLGFQPQPGKDPFPEDRPMRVGAIYYEGRVWRIHAHVIAETAPEAEELRYFRDRLRADAQLREAYVNEKRAILARGIRNQLDYSLAKHDFIQRQLRDEGG